MSIKWNVIIQNTENEERDKKLFFQTTTNRKNFPNIPKHN